MFKQILYVCSCVCAVNDADDILFPNHPSYNLSLEDQMTNGLLDDEAIDPSENMSREPSDNLILDINNASNLTNEQNHTKQTSEKNTQTDVAFAKYTQITVQYGIDDTLVINKRSDTVSESFSINTQNISNIYRMIGNCIANYITVLTEYDNKDYMMNLQDIISKMQLLNKNDNLQKYSMRLTDIFATIEQSRIKEAQDNHEANEIFLSGITEELFNILKQNSVL